MTFLKRIPHYLDDLTDLDKMNRKRWFVFYTAFIIGSIPLILNDSGDSNFYVMLAESFLNGKIELPTREGFHYMDLIHYQGKYYSPYPPFPAILLMPFVAIFGPGYINSVAITVVLTCLNFFLVESILRKLGIAGKSRSWLILAFFFGSPYWYVLITSHHVYGFAQMVAVTLMLLLLKEFFSSQRVVWMGLFIGLSFLSRQLTLFYFFFIATALFFELKDDQPIPVILKKIILLGIPVSLCVFAYMTYNYARFGDPLNTGYEFIAFIGVLERRVTEYGVFNWRYIPINLYNLFFKGNNIIFEGAHMMKIKSMDLFGTSLIVASPFLVASVKAQWATAKTVACWLVIILVISIQLMYHNNGYHQVNTHRFALDYLPLLFLLVSRGKESIPEWLFKGMVIYAILLNLVSFAVHFTHQSP